MSQTLPEKKRETTPEPWPSTDLDTVIEGMRRFLDQTFTGFTRWPVVHYHDVWSPPVDLEETDDAYVLEAELPGVDRNDVDVELIGNELTIEGEVKEKERTGVLRRQTRRSGRFSYWITLPEPVEANGVDASLKDGILKVRVPKAERAQRRKIELKA
ncbi:MAG TPA: Hsp20/alpha crystallin family protein [Gaiellaceae bacterium]|nr:Hsp20/alpha crystallin family protein [Gaiellaceae bacterium]